MSAGRAVVIDLGEVPRHRPGDEPVEVEAAGWLPAHRFLLWLLTLASAGLLLAGSVPGPRPMTPSTIPADARDMILYGPDSYHVFRLGDGQGERTVTAYRVPDGARLWHARMPVDRIGWLTSTPSGALLINPEGALPQEQAAVVATTGRVLYRAGGRLIGLLPSGHALMWTSRGGEFGVQGIGGSMVAREPSTGAVRWTKATPPGAWLWWDPTDGGLPEAAVLLPSGRLELWDLESGTMRAAADALRRRPVYEPPGAVQFVGDLVLVESWRGGRIQATAYGRQRLDRRWTIDMDLAGEYVTRCGAVLCAGSNTGGVRVLDPATGATLWASRRWTFLEAVGDALLAGPAGGRRNTDRGLAVLDPATGVVRTDLGAWTPVWPVPARGRPIAVRHDLRTFRTWIGRIDVERGRVFALGSVAGVTDDCRAGADFVTCRRPDGRIAAWRLPAR